MKKTYLGEFEEVVLLTVALLYDEAYGVAITETLQQQTRRSPSISAVHATLHRMEEKGWITSRLGGATAERGGRRKRYFTVTPAGSRALHARQQERLHLWKKIPPIALQWKIG